MFACSDAGQSHGEAGNASNDIVGGVDASGRGLDAVGAIVGVQDLSMAEQTSFAYCSGTLIAPRLVLTSKRCAVQRIITTSDGGAPTTKKQSILATYPLFFFTGGDLKNPSHRIRIDGVDVCTEPDEGGMDGVGCNAAVFLLQEPISDIAPLPFTDQALGAERLGQRFSTAGYGAVSNDRNDPNNRMPARHAGTLTLRAVSGAALAAVFPTEADFVAAWAKTEGEASAQQLASYYYTRQLQPGLEAWLGGADGDAQTCNGDPGAPLLAKDAEGKLTVFGVAAGHLGTQQTSCLPFGTTYAMLGVAVQSLIARNLVDPCESETSLGRCDGDVAVRCTTAIEGPRRITRSDCGAVFQRCVPPSATNVQVACAD